MSDERKTEELSASEMGEELAYPSEFPEAALQDTLTFLRGSGDVVSATHGAWEMIGYTLHELVGDPNAPAPAVAANPNEPPPVNATVSREQARSLRLGVPRGLHFGPVNHESLANELENLTKQHKEFVGSGDTAQHRMQMNGQWLKMLLPVLINVLQSLLA